MKVLYYDVFCGISGDMHLGALLDLGVKEDYLKTELRKLNIEEEYDIVVTKGMKCGISGTRVEVILHHDKGSQEGNHPHEHNHDHHHHHVHDHQHDDTHQHGHEHSHDDAHEHGHKHSHDDAHEHGHKHSHDHAHQHGHEHSHNDAHHHGHEHSHEHHHHRNFTMIKDMINNSTLSDGVKALSIEMFRLVAVAEGKVHNKPMGEVHFHEVGATDSIVDMVGAAICIDALQVDKIMASSIQVGGGFVTCAHGKMPVPAPATVEILQGVPLKYNLVPFETTTPTGAAILKATVSAYKDEHDMRIHKIGYGLGYKDFEVPNALRVYLGEIEDAPGELVIEKQYVMETNIDDMNPEIFTYIEQKLFDAGALDVYKTPIMMKKGRPAVTLSILFSKENREALQKIIFTETSSGGVRETQVAKSMLKRDFVDVETSYGSVKVKNLYYEGKCIKCKPEYEDCARLAHEQGVPIQAIYDAVKKKVCDAD